MKNHTPNTLGSLLERRAREMPDQVAYGFVGDTAGPTELTYGELARGAHAIAAQLREGGRRHERVLLLYPPGLEFIQAFLGCVAAGAIAVPAPPPNPLKPKRSLERLVSIVDSAWPKWALTTSAVHRALEPALAEIPAFDGIRWVATDRIPALPERYADLDPVDPSSVALVQYTSGSTSDPKGAALTHENVLYNVSYFDDGWEHSRESVGVNWLPAFHDLGLIYGILAPLWGGYLGIQMSPIEVIQRPLSWLKVITDHRATHSSGPNFIYELCTRKISDEELLALDLSSWRMALNAAEPVRAETLESFTARFSKVGFRAKTFSPGYGLSEATCKVCALPVGEPPLVLRVDADKLERHAVVQVPPGPGARTIVGCGRPTRDVGVAIVDPDTRRACTPGQVGEIWVSGPSVAQGYWGQPVVTDEVMRARIVGGNGTPYLRTGDLGFVHNGQLFITGRIKDLIIVRGNNHYPQDLEYTVQDAHPSIRAGCVAAFSYEEDGEEHLAVVAEVERRHVEGWAPSPDRRVEDVTPPLPLAHTPFVPEEVIACITRAIAEAHGLRVHRVELIRAGTIPKTTSGKIQRRACKRAMFAERLERIAGHSDGETPPKATATLRDEIRSKVTDIVSACGAVPREKLRPSESLHRFGIDSLAGVNIAYEIGVLTGRDVPSQLVAERDTIEKLVDFVMSLGGER
ncbi:AMP-binding protein [Myxococcota bacterium]|nr:AMP-binding protein [Myxococcota bacterium]